MQKEFIDGPFKKAYKNISKLKGAEKERAYADLEERIEIYSVAKDFADYYPKIYTEDVLDEIVNAKNNIEASNILTMLRRKQGD